MSRSGRFRPQFRRRGASTLDVAARTGTLVASSRDAVWPYWLERQVDPGSDAFMPLGTPPLARNLTHRNWTRVGTLEHGPVADVDPRGLVVVGGRSGALDWWVRGPDGWVHPSRCGPDEVSQALVDGTPVVRTRLDVGGGGAVHQTVYAATSPDRVVVEFRNETDAPVALALVVRPVDVVGARLVRAVAVTDATIDVDGAAFASFPDAPLSTACGRIDDGDLLALLSTTEGSGPCEFEDPEGRATAAAVVVVTHGRGFTAVLEPGPPDTTATDAVVDADAVVRGWSALRGRSFSVDVDASGMSDAITAQAGHLLAAGRARALEPEVARALCALDLHAHVRDALSRRVGGARGSGSAMDAVDFLLVAGELWRHTRDVDYFTGLERELTQAAVALEREVAAAGRSAADAGGVGPRLVAVAAAAAAAAEIAAECGAADIADAAPAIRAAAEEEADTRFASAHEHLTTYLSLALPWALARTWEPFVGAADPRLGAAVAAAGAAPLSVEQAGGGADLAATAALAHVLACTRSARAWDVLMHLIDAAAPTWTWPTIWNPRSRGGCGGDGADLEVSARFVAATAACCATPSVDGLALVPVAPPSRPLAVKHLATPYGYLDLQVRREGDATVLAWRGLWGRRTPLLTAPSLDPDWSTTEAAGTAAF